jgi:cell division protein FtsI (penicillin-binding protein 3)
MPNKRQDIVLRFGILYFAIIFLFTLIVYRIAVLQFVEKDKLMAMAAKNKKSDIIVRPNRGNIFACDGRLMASSIPTYYIFMDTRVPALHDDTAKLFNAKVDSLSESLSLFFRDRSKSEYKRMLVKAFNGNDGELLLYPKRISYAQLKEVRRMPLFRLGRNKSGLLTKELLRRVKPFGSLASRTIGDIYAEESKGGKNGLELYFNKELLGTPGISVRRKVANQMEETVEVEPVNGMDILTTIDVDLQDIAEKALVDSLKSFDASTGYAIMMEVKSGEVKAIVNMQKNEDGTYSENRNGAVSDQVEPGSTFKTMSLIAMLDDGKANINQIIHTGAGRWEYSGRIMTDHNASHGGFGDITLAEALEGSSNIGISKAVVEAYGDHPSAFVDKLYKMGLNERLNLEIPGTASPQIKHPKDKARYWSKTSLPWMSIGYETQIPPIYTLAYYNAIANNGKLIRPFFVKSIMKNGEVVKSFTTETIRESICRPSTLNTIKKLLIGVIEAPKGTAKNVHSDVVSIAGKTGTAQISKGKAGYKSGGTTHQVSFCGYFPVENPLYTCIVVIREPKNGYASGGKMAGSVFKSIAEQTMALKSNLKPEGVNSTEKAIFSYFPKVKSGNYEALKTVLTDLELSSTGISTDWVKTFSEDKVLRTEPLAVSKNKIPDMTGMGAKDALYLLGKMGLTVQLNGRGRVISQNIEPGTSVRKGQIIKINLE